ncbi:alpha/beta hydrolase [Chelatococcus asaccharovorans]|nr:alpha/beta hydrolase [Chelatococcus asaccharovorans]MBS7704576.1 alpha/beta hydrolase [Chelatococcus asaccharovorans]
MLELFATPDNAVPSGAAVSTVPTSDGINLRVARWTPRGRKRPRGTVLILQGRAEFIEKYFETVSDLTRRGFVVVAFDWRGQGGSDHQLANHRKGHVSSFKRYRRDLDAVINEVLAVHCPAPYFALAHSMGAAILFDALSSGENRFERTVALAPMLAIARIKHPGLVRGLAEALGLLGLSRRFIPGGGATPLGTKPFLDNRLTSDPVRYTRNAAIVAAAPGLGLGDPTIGWVRAAFRFMARLNTRRKAEAITAQVLVIAGGADPVVSTSAIERFSLYLKSGHAIVLPGARHELLMERDDIRETVWAAFDAFIPGTEEAEPPSPHADSSDSAAA